MRLAHVLRFPFLPSLLLLLFCLSLGAAAQPRYKLKRTKTESIPVTARLYGGYNGMSDPSDKLQDQFENTLSTSWGGIMIGLQSLIHIDTIGLPLWAGLDVNYSLVSRRFLLQIPTVSYVSDGSRVYADERLYGVAIHGLFAIDIFKPLQLQFGGGMQYLASSYDVDSEIEGTFEPVWVPCVVLSGVFSLLEYDHGSIEANLRAVKGFEENGSFHFQSILAFTFDF